MITAKKTRRSGRAWAWRSPATADGLGEINGRENEGFAARRAFVESAWRDAGVFNGRSATARAGRVPCKRRYLGCRTKLLQKTRASSFAALNLEPISSSPEEFAKFLKNDLENYAAIAKAAGIKPE